MIDIPYVPRHLKAWRPVGAAVQGGLESVVLLLPVCSLLPAYHLRALSPLVVVHALNYSTWEVDTGESL